MSVGGLHGTYVGNGRVLVRLNGGGRLLVSADDLSLMPELVTEGQYDGPFTAFLRRALHPDAVVVDVGANVGLFTIIAALTAWRGRVIAYEPVPDVACLLRDNAQLNWLDRRVDVRAVAVGSTSGPQPFRFDERLQALGGLAHEGAESSMTVPVVTLDNDLSGVHHIDLVKVDVEGGEAQVLRGMQRMLRAGRVSALSLEVRSDAYVRMGRTAEWDALRAELTRLAGAGWSFALIDPTGEEMQSTLAEVLATEPHPNVVCRPPATVTRAT